MEEESQRENPATDLQSSLRDHNGLSIMDGPTLEVRGLQLDLSTDPMLEARGHPQDHRTGLKADLKTKDKELDAKNARIRERVDSLTAALADARPAKRGRR